MFEQRSLKLDLAALSLLALTAFLAVSVLTYHPADPPGNLVWPEPTAVHNACGRSGAIVASLLLEALGVGAYYLVFSLAVVDSLLLARRSVGQPGLRAVGWGLSLVGLVTLSSMALPDFSPGPVIGAGGYLGATGRGLLELNFANVGAYILTISVLVGGLLLSTDYILVRLMFGAVTMPLAGVVATQQTLAARAQRRATARQSQAADAPASTGLNVRISGKTILREAEPADEEEAELEEDDAAEDDAETSADGEDFAEQETEQPAAVPKKGMGSRLASALGLKGGQRDERQEVMQELDAASRTEEPVAYDLPGVDLLLEGETIPFEAHEKEVRRKAKILEKTFADFGFKVKVVEIETGPVIAQFEVELEAGLRLAKITCLADDLAIALRVPSVRIVAPIPGKNTVGIEIPNGERQLVRLRDVIEESTAKAQKMHIPIFLGKDVSGKPLLVDLTTLPHLLIAGRTGTGKSVCLNSIIVSMLMTRRPDEVRMLMIDPKMVELSPYKSLPHLMHPVVTDMRKAEAILAWAVEKMEERYSLLASAGVRHISSYNQLGEEELMDRLQPECDEARANIPLSLPYIVIVADEMADLMMTAAKEVEQHIIRLAQKSRAVGIHLVLATQKPTVDVITGLIKSNLPARIAFQVASRTDSRVVLDEMGADKLLGNGDMLFLWPGTSTLIRGQGTYVTDDEINRIVDCVGTCEPQFVKELVQLKAAEPEGGDGPKLPNRDELYTAAVDVVVREGRGSVSLLQRALGIGYGRAARLVDFMAEDGIVGNYNGSQAREVMITVDQWQQMCGDGEASPAAPPKPSAATAAPKSSPAAAAKPAAKAPAPAPARPSRTITVAEPQPRIAVEDDAEEEVDEDELVDEEAVEDETVDESHEEDFDDTEAAADEEDSAESSGDDEPGSRFVRGPKGPSQNRRAESA